MLKIFFFLMVVSSMALAHENGESTKAPLFPAQIADKTLAHRPEAPELLEPAFLAKITGNTVTLKWQPVQLATNYHLQVATDPNFKWLVVNEPLYTGTFFEAKNLEAGKHYYWRVAAQKSTNEPAYTKGAFTKSMFETK